MQTKKIPTVSIFAFIFRAAIQIKKSCVWFDSQFGARYEVAANFIKAAPNIPGDSQNIEDAPYGSTLADLVDAIKNVDVNKGFGDLFELTEFDFAFPVLIESSETPHIFVAKPQNAPAYSFKESDNVDYQSFIEKYQTDFSRMNAVICDVAESEEPVEKPVKNLDCLARLVTI